MAKKSKKHSQYSDIITSVRKRKEIVIELSVNRVKETFFINKISGSVTEVKHGNIRSFIKNSNSNYLKISVNNNNISLKDTYPVNAKSKYISATLGIKIIKNNGEEVQINYGGNIKNAKGIPPRIIK